MMLFSPLSHNDVKITRVYTKSKAEVQGTGKCIELWHIIEVFDLTQIEFKEITEIISDLHYSFNQGFIERSSEV